MFDRRQTPGVAAPQLIELARRTFDTPQFKGIEFIEVEAKSAINHVPSGGVPFNWTLNPYRGCSHACTYCFAGVTHTYLGMNAGSDFERKIVVKVNVADVLRRELSAKKWKGEPIAMGTATDPYQRAEGRYRLMPKIIRAPDRLSEPVLDPHQVHADPQGSAAAAGGRRSHRREDGFLGRHAR